MNIKEHKRYTNDDVIEEANLYIKHRSMNTVAALREMPLSTVGWHLKYRLKKIDEVLWETCQVYAVMNRTNLAKQIREGVIQL